MRIKLPSRNRACQNGASRTRAWAALPWPLAACIAAFLVTLMSGAMAQPVAPSRQVDVVLLGDSITWAGNWESRFPGVHLVNRGIPGYKTANVLNEMDATIALRPKKAFLMIGINDLLGMAPVDQVYDTTVAIVRRLQAAAAGRMSLVISHRPEMLQWVQRAVVLRDGALAEDGAPETLREAGGEFARLFGS